MKRLLILISAVTAVIFSSSLLALGGTPSAKDAAATYDAKTPMAIWDSTPLTGKLLDELQPGFAAKNVPLMTERYQVGDRDFTALTHVVNGRAPDYLFCLCRDAEAKSIFDQLKASGFKGQVIWIKN